MHVNLPVFCEAFSLGLLIPPSRQLIRVQWLYWADEAGTKDPRPLQKSIFSLNCFILQKLRNREGSQGVSAGCHYN